MSVVDIRFCHVNPFAGAEANIYEFSVYTWGVINGLHLEIGFLVDQLTVTMMVVVTFVSLMVHIYTIGYMSDDPGYQRFFSYIALFTFFMLMLCMANNFLQLFFGWEGVGLMSYLLIGFWYERDSAIYANLKAFLVNRVGDFGFVLGIAAVLMYFGTLHYGPVFENAEALRTSPSRFSRDSHGRFSRWCACCCLSARWASPRKCPCMCGCPTRWRARHPFRHSSTRQLW